MATYGKKASEKVEQVMHERKTGTLKSGSGEKVTDPKQAIAIALSEARKEGDKVPFPPKKTACCEEARQLRRRPGAMCCRAGNSSFFCDRR
jgi:hypothetical protein